MTDQPTLTPFRPSWWLRGPHAQTVGGRFLRGSASVALRRERLETPDGDFLDLDFTPEPSDPSAPLVVVLHGLEGGTASGYMGQTFRELARAGLRGVGVNFRSCGGEMNRTARFYHAGETEDLAFVLKHLAERFPGVQQAALGFSLGGNVLLKYLGEPAEEGRARLVAAATVSVPFDLGAGADRLEQGVMSRVYTTYFMRRLRRKSLLKAELLAGRCDTERALRARTLREFDDAATAPLHGFRSAADYYARSSSARYLADIRVPTLLLQASDDPFLPPDFIPRETIERNPALTAAISARGGHVGFVSGPPWAPVFWAEREAVAFLRRHLEAASR
jgi:predicted alpha/beta-fold hydrolase